MSLRSRQWTMATTAAMLLFVALAPSATHSFAPPTMPATITSQATCTSLFSSGTSFRLKNHEKSSSTWLVGDFSPLVDTDEEDKLQQTIKPKRRNRREISISTWFVGAASSHLFDNDEDEDFEDTLWEQIERNSQPLIVQQIAEHQRRRAAQYAGEQEEQHRRTMPELPYGNCYDILRLRNQYATTEEIKAAYRRLAKIWHPDVNDHEDAVARFHAINRAYETLIDPVLRERYDRTHFRDVRKKHKSSLKQVARRDHTLQKKHVFFRLINQQEQCTEPCDCSLNPSGTLTP